MYKSAIWIATVSKKTLNSKYMPILKTYTHLETWSILFKHLVHMFFQLQTQENYQIDVKNILSTALTRHVVMLRCNIFSPFGQYKV